MSILISDSILQKRIYRFKVVKSVNTGKYAKCKDVYMSKAKTKPVHGQPQINLLASYTHFRYWFICLIKNICDLSISIFLEYTSIKNNCTTKTSYQAVVAIY